MSTDHEPFTHEDIETARQNRHESTAPAESPRGLHRRSDLTPCEATSESRVGNPGEGDSTGTASEPAACNHPRTEQGRGAKGHFTSEGARPIVAGKAPERRDGDSMKTLDTRRAEILAHFGDSASAVELALAEEWAFTKAELDTVSAYMKRVGPIGRGRVRRVALHYDRLCKRLERLSRQIGLKARTPAGPTLEEYARQLEKQA